MTSSRSTCERRGRLLRLTAPPDRSVLLPAGGLHSGHSAVVVQNGYRFGVPQDLGVGLLGYSDEMSGESCDRSGAERVTAQPVAPR